MMNNTNGQKTIGWQIQREEIENCILELVQAPVSATTTKRRKNIQDAISLSTVIRILVNAINLFRSEPTMVEFNLDVNCIVVGDLHGYINDLLGTLILTELPPDHRILFLGDYVGRGNHQLDVLLLIVLLKLRWPKYVYVLRGNHESPMDDTDGFETQCKDTYGTPEVYKLCTIMFDYMPIAAVIEDSVFCCHGGISQWATTRQAIQQIQRPVYYTTTPLLQMLIFTDLLWADPVREPNQSDRLYLPSTRFASYMFTETALRGVLDGLNCDMLIRGHEAVQNGITVQWHGNCITVHTTSRIPDAPTRSSFVCLYKNPGISPICVETRNNPLDALSVTFDDGMLYTQLRCYLKLQFKRDSDIEVQHYNDKDLEEVFQMQSHPEIGRFLNYTDLFSWSLSNGNKSVKALKQYSSANYAFDKTSSYAASFPLVLDLTLGNGRTFRTQITKIEKEAIETIYKCSDLHALSVENWPKVVFSEKIVPNL